MKKRLHAVDAHGLTAPSKASRIVASVTIALGASARPYVAFAAVGIIAVGDPALVVAAGLLELGPTARLVVRAVVSSLQVAVGVFMGVCTLALSLLLTTPKARRVLLRHRQLTVDALLAPSNRPDSAAFKTPKGAASRATPFDLLLDALACIVLIGKGVTTPQAFGVTSAVARHDYDLVAWLICTWCFSLPQFCYVAVANDTNAIGYARGVLRSLCCRSSLATAGTSTNAAAPPPPLAPAASEFSGMLGYPKSPHAQQQKPPQPVWLREVSRAMSTSLESSTPETPVDSSLEQTTETLLRNFEGRRRTLVMPRSPTSRAFGTGIGALGAKSGPSPLEISSLSDAEEIETARHSAHDSEEEAGLPARELVSLETAGRPKASKIGRRPSLAGMLCSFLANTSLDAAPRLRRASVFGAVLNAAALLAVLISWRLIYEEVERPTQEELLPAEGKNGALPLLTRAYQVPTAGVYVTLVSDALQLFADVPLVLLYPTWLRACCAFLDAVAIAVTGVGVATASGRDSVRLSPNAYVLAAFVLAQAVRLAARLLEVFRGAAIRARRLQWDQEEDDDDEEAGDSDEDWEGVDEDEDAAGYGRTSGSDPNDGAVAGGSVDSLALSSLSASAPPPPPTAHPDGPLPSSLASRHGPKVRTRPQPQVTFVVMPPVGGPDPDRAALALGESGESLSHTPTPRSPRGKPAARAGPGLGGAGARRRRATSTARRRSTVLVDRRLTGKPVNILALDGGGVKGLNLLAMGRELEERTGKALCDTFDLVCGTSIGGAGAAAIAMAKGWGEGPEKSEQLLFGLIDNVMRKSSTCHYMKRERTLPPQLHLHTCMRM